MSRSPASTSFTFDDQERAGAGSRHFSLIRYSASHGSLTTVGSGLTIRGPR